MNIYQVVRLADKVVIAEGFGKREEAKKIRDSYNTTKNPTFCIVGRGKDHPRGPSFGPVEQSKRWL